MNCTNCGADHVVVHSTLTCVSTAGFWECSCCHHQLCLTCRETDFIDDGKPELCDACWCQKFDPEDEMTDGFRLLVEFAFRQNQKQEREEN